MRIRSALRNPETYDSSQWRNETGTEKKKDWQKADGLSPLNSREKNWHQITPAEGGNNRPPFFWSNGFETVNQTQTEV